MLSTAHARACLIGEHCDWAGQGASLVLPLQAQLHVQTRASDWGLVVHSELGHTRADATGRCLPQDPNRYVVSVARTLAKRGVPLPPARVLVRSQIPIGRGLASSAALCVAATRSLAAHAGITLSDAQVADIAFQAEAEDLGVPCGRLDQLACMATSPTLMTWPDETFKVLSQPAHALVVCLPEPVPAGPLLKAFQSNPQALQAALQVWGQGALRASEALESADWAALGGFMNQAQSAYEAIDLAIAQAPKLSALCTDLRVLGATGAKFMGAGGERSAIAVFESDQALEEAARLLGEKGLICIR
ncbi:MAG: mevalonate kinase [Cognaticolwellia sp.]|jgi:mevalonate kinase